MHVLVNLLLLAIVVADAAAATAAAGGAAAAATTAGGTDVDELPWLGFFDVPFTLAVHARPSPSKAARTASKSELTTTGVEKSVAWMLNQTQLSDFSKNFARLLSEVCLQTGGFVSVSPTPQLDLYNDGKEMDVAYIVLYNKTALNELGAFSPQSTFLDQLDSAFTKVWMGMKREGTLLEAGGAQYSLDDYRTSAVNQNTIDNLYIEFNSSEWVCGSSLCNNLADSCYLNLTSGNVTCVSKCGQFESLNHCTYPPSVPGVYVKGTCRLDPFYYPYCNCGSSAGDVMTNFYDGVQCVSVTFVVAMSASGGAFLLLIIIILYVIARKQRQALIRAAARLEEYNNTDKYTHKPDRAASSDLTLDAVVDSTKSNCHSPDVDLYDGPDLYTYLKKDPLYPVSTTVTSIAYKP